MLLCELSPTISTEIMAPEREVVLIDGSSFLFRAYHALGRQGGLSTASGQPTHAIFGVINMLRGLLKERQPEYVAMVLDAKGKTFRHTLYPQYKANRPPMPEDLRPQLEYVKKIIPAMGIRVISEAGVEADDVIGTLTKMAGSSGLHSLIVSGDKDLTQLIDERVIMVDTMKDSRLDAAAVEARFGVPPQRMVEYLALMGDSVDNIPGIPLVGPKTAVKWLHQFGSLDQIIAHADTLPGKVGDSLRDNLPQLALCRQLVTLKCDLDLPLELDDLRLQPPDKAALRVFFRELEFRSWLRELETDDSIAASPRPVVTYETILDPAALQRWLARLKRAPVFALDTETTSIDAQRARLVGLCFAVDAGQAAYLPLAHNYAGVPKQLPFESVLASLRPILEDPAIAKTGQNLKYDWIVLRHHGIELRGITHDTMLMSYLLDAGRARHALDALAMQYLGHRMIRFADVAGSGRQQLSFDQVALEQATPYAAEDADITLQLHQILAPRIAADVKLQRLLDEIEMPLMRVLAVIESNGVKVDAGMLQQQSAEIAVRLQQVEAQAHACAGEVFNIASPRQIQAILFDKLQLRAVKKTAKGQPSTDESVLHELAVEHPLPQIILQHRGLAKLKNTYTDKLPELINPASGRIHTSYHQAVAATGRLSSSDPNLQNIPIRTQEGRRIREAFIPEAGRVLLSADYSQIELRIMAHLSADPGLVRAFAQGLDVHAATAAEVFGVELDAVDAEQRRRAKAINFGLIYGMSAFGLARQLNIEQQQARQYMEIYFDRYPGVRQYMHNIRESARQHGYVETIYGRRLNLPEINARNAQRRQYAERTAINAPMQGSAADLIKLAMLVVQNWIEQTACGSKIILQVHDELVLEVPQQETETTVDKLTELMTGVAVLTVPLVVDIGIGKNWKQAH